MIEIGTRHWFLAVGAALIIHTTSLALIQTPISSRIISAASGIEISLGPTVSAPGSWPISATKPSDVRVLAPDEVSDKLSPELIPVTAPEGWREPAASGEALQPMTARVAVTMRKVPETPILTPKEALSKSPEEDVAVIRTETMLPTAALVMSEIKMPDRQGSRTAAPYIVSSERHAELVFANSPETVPVAIHKSPGTGTVAPDEASSKPSQESAVSSVIADVHSIISAKPVRVVPDASVEIAPAVKPTRQIERLTQIEKHKVLSAKPEDPADVHELLPAKEITPQITERIYANLSEELMARQTFTTSATRPNPESRMRRRNSTPVPTDVETVHQKRGPASTNIKRSATEQVAELAPGVGGRNGTLKSNDARSGDATPGAVADYYAQLQAWLEEHKRYPRRARFRNEQGVVLLRFVIMQGGEVRSFTIEKSSGHFRLDEAARKMLQRAQPLPKIPPELLKDQLEILVPIQFLLK